MGPEGLHGVQTGSKAHSAGQQVTWTGKGPQGLAEDPQAQTVTLLMRSCLCCVTDRPGTTSFTVCVSLGRKSGQGSRSDAAGL